MVERTKVLQSIAFTVPYADGPKYLKLVRDPSKPDILMEILKPVTQAE